VNALGPAGPERTAASVHRFKVNGRTVEVIAPGGRRLLDVLRLDLGLTGAKEGCGEGECGACSVLLDGEVVDSCLVSVCQVEGRELRTVEGLAVAGRLDPLQAAFVATGGVQCGICTPGMLMAGRAFLDSGAAGPNPTDQAIREAIAGNLCRCTGYGRIVEAIRLAAAGNDPSRSMAVGTPRLEAEATPGTKADVESDDAPKESAAPKMAGTTGTTGIEAWPTMSDAPETELDRVGLDLGDPEADTPRTLTEAYALLAEGGRRILAGGTDVLVERTAGDDDGRRYLNLAGLAALHERIRIADGWLLLGAGTTYVELRRSPLAAEYFPVLTALAAEVGTAQIQNRGTLGGNIATASPAGDSLPVLLALDAQIVVGSAQGERTIPAAEFFLAYRRTALAADELILRIMIPIRSGRTAVFRKVGARRTQIISVVALAVAWRPEHGRWHDVRVALGSVAPTPIRARATEAVLEGASPTAAVADRAVAALMSEITPIDDVRASADYRRTVAGLVLRRIITDAGGAASQ
jgi:xanthine dehydrogenase small subunit